MRVISAFSQSFCLLACLVLSPCRLQSQATALSPITSTEASSGVQTASIAGHRAFLLGDLPLQFEENAGQAGSDVRFSPEQTDIRCL